MIINQIELLKAAPIVDMHHLKLKAHGVSYGLTEAGYDIRIRQTVKFLRNSARGNYVWVDSADGSFMEIRKGRFALASSIEMFEMPDNLVGVVHDKSTWARRGLSVFNTVLEPGWCGGLTLELVYHGEEELIIPAGAGIAQVLFSRISTPTNYTGKYSNQSTDPVPAIFEES